MYYLSHQLCLFVTFMSYIYVNLALNFIDLPDTDQPNDRLRSCSIGDVIQNDCHKCKCTHTFYDCLPIPCNVTQAPPERGHDIEPRCHSNTIYIENGMTCICDQTSQWQSNHCNNTFGLLPESKIVKEKCEPESYVIIDCNVCRCSSEGIIDETMCTKNNCTNNARRHIIDDLEGTCEPNQWYSLAACQVCYCVNAKRLVCNTGATKETVDIGTSKFTKCSIHVLEDANSLIPIPEKNSGVTDVPDSTDIEDANSLKQILDKNAIVTDVPDSPDIEDINSLIPIPEKNAGIADVPDSPDVSLSNPGSQEADVLRNNVRSKFSIQTKDPYSLQNNIPRMNFNIEIEDDTPDFSHLITREDPIRLDMGNDNPSRETNKFEQPDDTASGSADKRSESDEEASPQSSQEKNENVNDIKFPRINIRFRDLHYDFKRNQK